MDDEGLVGAAGSGDLGATEALLARHQRLAYTTALRPLGEPAAALLPRLPDTQRSALLRRDAYEYDPGEIGALQGCGLSAAKARVSRARTALRSVLACSRRWCGMVPAAGLGGRETVAEIVKCWYSRRQEAAARLQQAGRAARQQTQSWPITRNDSENDKEENESCTQINGRFQPGQPSTM